jgi:hypothetical protein
MADVGFFSLGSTYGEVTHKIAANAEVLGVIFFGGVVSAAVRTPEPSQGVQRVTFYLVGNGQKVPDHTKYLGTVHNPQPGALLMVFYAPSDA